jgi:conjugal transfer pilus assembly protein TraW
MNNAYNVLFLLMIITSVAYSKDFGIHGNVFLIQEEDARETFIKSAARVDWENARKKIKASIVDLKANDHGLRALYPPNEDVITFIDPSVTAQRDIYAPYIKDGDVKRELLIAKGTKINPLDYMEPTSHRLFINGLDPYQLEMVEKMVNEYHAPLQVILVKGSVTELEKLIGVNVYQASPEILDENHIDFTPSIMTVSRHPEYLKQMQVTSLSRPFDIARLLELITYE